MRRLLADFMLTRSFLSVACLLSAALLLSACGPATTEQADIDKTGPESASAETISEAMPRQELAPLTEVPTGRDALVAATGQPHVLWFWGAH